MQLEKFDTFSLISGSILYQTLRYSLLALTLKREYLSTLQEAKLYIQSVMGNVLTEALVSLCKVKPQDPIAYLGHYLIQHNPNAPRISED